MGTRKSERQKKPSSRFNEEVGYLAEVPKSAKIKAVGGKGAKGTSSKPLLIFYWSNVQIANYCDACGISFSDHVIDCVNHIHSLELLKAVNLTGVAVSSSEGRGN